MAGLPKAGFVLLLTLGIATTLAIAGAAEDIQTGSVVLPPIDVQTPSNVLQPVFDLIDTNVSAAPIDQENLKADFESAVTLEVLTPEEALAMLALVEWETLDDAEALASMSAALQTVLADLISDPFSEDDPLVELTRLLDALATPAGTLTAIGKAGASEGILDQVSSIVASGVPPGILVQITKKALRDGLSMAEIAERLDELVAALAEDRENVSWGNLAHDITGEGEYQDQEQNENIDGNEEPEEEANEHGDGTDNNGKKDAPPGQDDKSDKKDK